MPFVEAQADLDDRLTTLRLIDWFKVDRVRSARVAVIGAGAIGNEVLKNLALLSVGNIFIFDRDTIEKANLSRSILYRESDNGRPKAETAAQAIKEINPDVKVSWFDGDIRTNLGEGFIRTMDAVIACLDSVEARHMVNRRCYIAGRPWIDAGIGALTGQVNVFLPPDGVCYECVYAEVIYGAASCGEIASGLVSQGRTPTTPMMASLVAAIQVQEFLKLLTPENWGQRTLAGREFSFSGKSMEVDIFALQRRDRCMRHFKVTEEMIVALPDFGAEQTAGELLEVARIHLGGPVVLQLDEDVFLERHCPDCKRELNIYRPKSQVMREQLDCECGKSFRYDSDLTDGRGGIGQVSQISVSSSPKLLTRRLVDLGVARWGMVEALTASAESYFLELQGDQAIWF